MRLSPARTTLARSLPRGISLALYLAALPTLFPQSAHASDWINTTGGGLFGGSINWSAGVPGPGQIANFTQSTATVVTFVENANTGSLTLSAGAVTFRASSAPQTYTLTNNTSITGGSLTLGLGISGQPLTMNSAILSVAAASLFVTEGNLLSATAFNFATSGPGTGNLTVDNATFNASATTLMGQSGGVANLIIRNNAVGIFSDIFMTNSSFATSGAHVTIQTGASVSSFGSLLIGPGTVAGQSSTILVDGTASSFTQTGSANLTLGSSANSTASITIINGGTFTTSTGTTTINATGTLAITNGTFNGNGNVLLDHGTLTYNGGAFNLANSKTLTAQNAATVNFNSLYNIPGGRTVLIQSGAHFNASNYVDLNDDGGAGTATLIVDGSGSSFTTTNNPWIGANGGSGVLTIRNNATASIASRLDIAVTAIPGTSGTVNVQSGARLTVAGDINLAAQGATGLIHITDGTLIQTSGLMTLGDSTGPSGTVLTIDATVFGGTFTSSTSGITINKSGTLNVNAGLLNANGDITLNGGTFNKLAAGIFNLVPGKNLTAQNNATAAFNSFGIPGGSTFTINSGSHLSATNLFDVGNGTGPTPATLIVDGSSSSLSAINDSFWGHDGGTAIVTIRNNATASVASNLTIADDVTDDSKGTLSLQSGAQLTVAGSLRVATSGGNAVGLITVTDALLTQTTGGLLLGSPTGTGTATLTINNATGSGGTFSSASDGIFLYKNATINLNAGTFNANGNILLDGGTFNYTGGTFNLFTNRNLTAQNGATLNFIAYNIPGGSTFTIKSGAHLSDPIYFDVGNSTGANPATLIVDGSGSSFSTSNFSYWGAFSGNAVVTIRNNATASITALEIAASSLAGTTGTVNIQSGAKLTIAGNLGLAIGGGNAVGAITVTDATLTQTVGTLTLGSVAGSGTATLTINNATGSGGTVTSATGGIIVRKNAAINLNAGTLNANGNVTLDGGTLQVNGTASTLTLAAGKNLTAQNGASVTVPFYTVPAGSTFTIQTGSHLTGDSFVGGIPGATGSLTIDGSSSSFSAGASIWGAGGGTGVVTIRNNATASITGLLYIAYGDSVPTFGTVNVQSGAQLTVSGPIAVGTVLSSNATGVVHVTDATLTQTSGGNLAIGNTTGTGSANFTLDGATGGTYNASNGGLAVYQSGSLDIVNGTFNASVNLLNNGTINLYNGGNFAGNFAILNYGSVKFARTNVTSLAQPITGPGSLSHFGSGTTTLTGLYSATGPINVAAGKLIFANATAARHTSSVLLVASSLTLAASTTLDATNHDLMIGNSTLAIVQARILKGFNRAGTPTDPALTSSTALSAGNTFLVPIDADALLGIGSPRSAIGYNFDGVFITQPATILVKYTYIGDVTLDGKIDGLDFATAAGHFGQSTPGLANIQNSWLFGDINLDGIVNTTDFTIMNANAPTSQLSPLGLLNLTPVPEPTSLALLLAATPILLSRRRRRSEFRL